MKIRHRAAAWAAAALAVAPAARAQDRYHIDPVHSSVGFKVKHMMVSDVRGSFEDFAGTIALDPKNVEKSTVEVTIQAASIFTNNEKRDGHLKSADFFDAEKFPTLTFKSKHVRKSGDGYVLVGDLTIRDVTREVEFPFTLAGPVSAGERSIVGASASLEINRHDYGVSWNKVLDAGGVVVSEKVRIEIEVEAVKSAS